MKRRPLALGIRAQLLLVLTVFLALPWLGYEYVRELERFLRDAQERTLAGTAQAVATALHERPRLFAAPADPDRDVRARARRRGGRRRAALPPPASPEIEQIVQGLSRTTARIWVIDRDLVVLARAGIAAAAAGGRAAEPAVRWPAPLRRRARRAASALRAHADAADRGLHRRGSRRSGPSRGRDVEGALAGILTTDRRTTSDGKAVDRVGRASDLGRRPGARRGVVEETTNRVLAERNRAFERLFNIVLAVLLIGSLALTLFASRLSARIRRLRDDAEAAIDAQGRTRAPLASSSAGDEIGDLSRSFASALARLSQYAAYQEAMAGRLAHELRTPVAVVKSSLENLEPRRCRTRRACTSSVRAAGLARLDAILTRMTEATRLEGGAARRRARALRPGGRSWRAASKAIGSRIRRSPSCSRPPAGESWSTARPTCARRCSTSSSPTRSSSAPSGDDRRHARRARTISRASSVTNDGPPLPDAMAGRLFDSMVSVRDASPARAATRRTWASACTSCA